MADFLDKLASFSSLAGGSRGFDIDRGLTPQPLAITPPADMVIPAPDAPAVPTIPVESAPLMDPRQKVAQDLNLINNALSSPTAMALVNTSRERDNVLTRDNQVLRDADTLSAPEFILKYGDETYQKVSALNAGRNHLADLSSGSRDTGEVIGDVAIGVGSGAAQAAGSLGVLALSGISDRAAVAAAEGLKSLKETTDGLQSRTMQQRRFVDSLRGTLDRQDDQAKFEKDKKNDGELVASLKSIGRGILSGTGRLIEDPMMLEAGISEAGGSLLIGGPISRGLTAGGAALAQKVAPAAAGAMGGAGARAAAAASTAALPVTIGAMEAGGSFAQTVQEVMELSHDQLQKNSSAYRELRARGLSERDAKIELAAQAGNVASALTFPVAALAGTLVQRFESAPLTAGLSSSPKELLGNIVREGAEEFTQSGVGQFAGNVGQRLTVDPTKNLAEGVGEQAIQGAIFGAGSGGVLQAPGLAMRGVREAGRSLGQAVDNAVTGRADAIRAENETQSGVSFDSLAPQVRQELETAPQTAEVIRAVASDPAIPEAEKPQVQALAAEVEKVFSIQPEEVAFLDPVIQEIVGSLAPDGRPNRLDWMAGVAAATVDESLSQEARTDAALWLMDQKAKHDAFIRTGQDVLGKLDHERPEFVSFQRFSQVLANASQMPAMREALNWARDAMTAPVIESPADLKGPEAQALIRTTAEIARLAPEKIDLASADVILRQDKLAGEDAKLLSPMQRQDIHAAQALALASQAYIQTVGTEEDRVETVNRQIETMGGKGGHQKSLTQHVFDINFAMRNGMQDAAGRRIRHLGQFARSMRNKLDAMNEAISKGDRKDVAYRALGPNGWLPKDGKQRVFYNPGTEKSRRLAKQIHADTVAVATLANAFAREYPQFGMQEIEIPALVAEQIETAPVPEARRGSSQASKDRVQSQATTSETDPDPSQIELPLPGPEVKGEPLPEQAPVSMPAAAPVKAPAAMESEVSDSAGEAPVSAVLAAPVKGADDTARTEAPSSEAVVDRQTQNDDAGQDTTQKTSEAFPRLVTSQGRNFFHEALRFTRNQTSNLMAAKHPMVWVNSLLESPAKLQDEVGIGLNKIQTKAYQGLMKLLDAAYDAMSDRLQGKTGNDKTDKAIQRKLDLLAQDGENLPVLRFDDAKVLNIAEKLDKGGVAYNQQLMQSALLAGMDWLINAQSSNIEQDRDELATSLGLDFVTEDMAAFFAEGLSVDQAKQQLANRIVEFWGMRRNPDADIAYARGIPEAVALEVMLALQSAGLLHHVNESRFFAQTGKNYGRIYFDNRSDNVQEIISNISGVRDVFGKVAMIEEAPRGVAIGSPIREVSQTQLRNASVKNTAQQKRAIKREQEQRYLPNLVMADLVEAIGEDGMIVLLTGRTNLDGLNVNHARSIEGKIRGIAMAVRNILSHRRELEAYADRESMDLSEVPTFYRHEITRVGRLQMLGNANPQSDKIAREIFMPTRSVLNLTDAGQMDFFWLTVAQGLGIKTEKETRSVAREKAEGLVTGQYAPAIQELKTWLKERNEGRGKKLELDLVNRIRDAGQGKLSMHGLHSLISVAQLELARETGADLSRFTHFNYLEADGKTNGPINALMLLTAGKFDLDWLKAVGKGGVFFGKGASGKTLNAHAQTDSVDLYGAGANAHKTKMADLLSRISDNAPVMEQFDALGRVLDALNADVAFDEGSREITISRGVVKNPLTITIYGSGIDGIAGKVTAELVDWVYEHLSDGTMTQELSQDLQTLTRSMAVFNKQESAYEVVEGVQAKRPFSEKDAKAQKTAEGFTFQRHQFETLKTNIRTLFVNPLNEAITDTVMGHVQRTTDEMKAATQIQSIVMRALYRRGIVEALLAKRQDPNWREGDFLSQRELDGILEKTLKMGPVMSTGTQSYFFGGSEQGDILGTDNASAIEVNGVKTTVPQYFARSLDGTLSASPLLYGPTLAGVKAVPSTVIGSGDGQMMLNASTNTQIENVLKVFDGMNMPADQIETYSRLINGEVHKTWLQNPVRALSDSFKAFAANQKEIELAFDLKDEINSQSRIASDALKAMTSVLTGNPNPDISMKLADALELIQFVSESLETISDEIDARQRVLRKVTMTVDQMASGETPFIQDGVLEGEETLTAEALIEAMNRELDAREAPAGEAQSVSSVPAATEVRVIEAKGLTIQSLGLGKDLDDARKELLTASLNALRESGYRVVLGSASDVDAWLQNNNADRYQPGQLDGANGMVDPVSKILVVTNGSSETALHELIHAATYQKVVAYYADPKTLPEIERLAIENIESLMGDWLEADFSGEGDLVRSAQGAAAGAIRSHLAKDRKAAAVNEFMAWVLSNQHLTRSAEKMGFTSVFAKVGQVLQAIGRLVFGKKAAGAGDNLLAQLRFSTKILLETPNANQRLVEDSGVIALYQSQGFGSSDRLSDLRQRFHAKVVAWIGARPERQKTVDTKVTVDADAIAATFVSEGYLSTMQELSTFKAILSGLAVDAELNPNSLSLVQDVFDHVVSERDVLQGLFGTRMDPFGRSSVLPSFLALAMVDETFRETLRGMKLPKTVLPKGATLDDRLTNIGLGAMDRLGRLVSGQSLRAGQPNLEMLLDQLTDAMLANVGDTRSFIEQKAENGIDGVDRYLHSQAQNLSEKVRLKARGIVQTSSNRAVRAGARVVALTAGLVNEQGTEAVSQGVISLLNRSKGLQTVREFANDVIGRHASNAPLFDLITPVRSTVQQTRQQYREHLPKVIAQKFSRKLTGEEWSALHQALGKTDLATIQEWLGTLETLDLVMDPQRLSVEIATLENQIKQAERRRAPRMLAKAEQLAHFMVTGEHGTRLLRNAYAVSRLVGEKGFATSVADPAFVAQIDRLVSLYALGKLDQGTRDTLSSLAQSEADGIGFALSYLTGLRKTENDKAVDEVSRLNGYKGAIPSEGQQGASLVVASASEHSRLVKLGYEKLGDYTGSSADRNLGQRSYYFTPQSGRSAYNQGVMQTVHETVNGVDPRSGYTVNELTAGRISDPQIVAIVDRQLSNQRQTSENLLPVYGANGQVVAFERALDPARLGKLTRDTDLSRMIGVWAGRQVEEVKAKEFNRVLVQRLSDIWQEGKKTGRKDEFINLAQLKKTDDPVLHEAWRLVPSHTREMIQDEFGRDAFWVRRDMLNDAVGYRSASIGDVFTGDSRWSKPVQKRFEDAALSIFGNKAYAKAVLAERTVQDLVTNAKVLIVVKSVVVPMANLMSNIVQLVNRGVPIKHVIRGLGSKTAELNDFIKRRHQEIELEAQLQAAQGLGDQSQIDKITARIQAIKDSYKRLSIWPLIEAGEFSAISNGVVTAEDLALAEGKWGEWAERLSAKVPEQFRTAWRYGMITRDTALFQGLGKATQYGDFLGKAILYEDLTRRKKLGKADAIAQVNEAFINYNRLAGRSRQYLESVGLLWFYNFKLRSIKEGLYMMRHHPLRSILLMGMPASLPVVGSIGSPLTDNFLGILADGKLGYSIGPGMGLNSFSLNPWVNMVR